MNRIEHFFWCVIWRKRNRVRCLGHMKPWHPGEVIHYGY